jgi:hypothetical protein
MPHPPRLPPSNLSIPFTLQQTLQTPISTNLGGDEGCLNPPNQKFQTKPAGAGVSSWENFSRKPLLAMNPSIRLLIAASLIASPIALAQEPAPGAPDRTRDHRRPPVERPASPASQPENRPERSRPAPPRPEMRQPQAGQQMERLQGAIREQNSRMEQAMRQRDERLAAAARDFDARLKRLEAAAKPPSPPTAAGHPAHKTNAAKDHDAMRQREKAAAQKLEAQARELATMKERLIKQEKELKARATELDVRAKRLEALEKRLREMAQNPRKERRDAE